MMSGGLSGEGPPLILFTWSMWPRSADIKIPTANSTYSPARAASLCSGIGSRNYSNSFDESRAVNIFTFIPDAPFCIHIHRDRLRIHLPGTDPGSLLLRCSARSCFLPGFVTDCVGLKPTRAPLAVSYSVAVGSRPVCSISVVRSEGS